MSIASLITSFKTIGMNLDTDGSGHSQAFRELPRPCNERGVCDSSMLVIAFVFFPLHHPKIFFPLGLHYTEHHMMTVLVLSNFVPFLQLLASFFSLVHPVPRLCFSSQVDGMMPWDQLQPVVGEGVVRLQMNLLVQELVSVKECLALLLPFLLVAGPDHRPVIIFNMIKIRRLN